MKSHEKQSKAMKSNEKRPSAPQRQNSQRVSAQKPLGVFWAIQFLDNQLLSWVDFCAQAQHFVHSGFPTLSNNSPTAAHVLWAGVSFRAIYSFFASGAFTLPWVAFTCTGAALRAFWVANPIQPFSDRTLFVIHRRCASCTLHVFANCA